MLENNSSFINHTFRKYLIPSILSLLGMTVISFLNSMFTGSILGQEALAAMNLIHPIIFIFAMLGCLINIGGAVCTSIAQGKNEEERAESFVTFSLAASIVIPLLVSGLGALFFKQFMGMLGARGELYSLIEGYGRIMLLGGVFTTLLYYPFNFLRINGKSQIAMLMFAVMGVADVGLALTFLHMGLGLLSIGLAVILSTALADVTGLCCLFWGGKIKLGRIGRLTDVGLQVAKAGSAAGLNNLCNLLRTTFLNALILKAMGAGGVSVFAVGCSVLNFATAFVAGCGQTVSPFIGVYYGEKDYNSIRVVMKTAVRYALWIHTVVFLVCTVCSMPIAGWFGMTEPDMKRAAAGAVFWIALSLIPSAVNNVYIFYYTTIRHVRLASWTTFLRSFGAVAVFAWIICGAGFPQWIFCAFPAGEIFTLLFLKGYCKWLCRRQKELSGMLLINTKEEEEIRCISFSAEGTPQGAVKASEVMSSFCEESGMDGRLCMMLPLALEEMLVLLGEHCLKDGNYADIRIRKSGGGMLLWLRCGGKLFDPVECYKRQKAEKAEEELLAGDMLGMKMIVDNAESVTFRRTLGVNNLVIIL